MSDETAVPTMIVTLLLAARRMRTDEAVTPAIVDKQFDVAKMILEKSLARREEFEAMFDRAHEARRERREKRDAAERDEPLTPAPVAG